jgi:LmbE family N-acetylglucosaminyl deacetylase
MKERILAVGAHPDDIEIGCGGTIVKHLDLGDEVFVLIMTNGENGNHPQDRRECLSSLKSIGIKDSNIVFGNFPDGNLPDNKDTVNFIEKYIIKFGITKIYTHDPNDRHQDHRNCSNAVSSAARNIPEILLFEGPSTKVNFEPHYFIELSEREIIRKINALNYYQSQIVKNTLNLRWIENLAGIHSPICRLRYSEGFAINHILKKNENV